MKRKRHTEEQIIAILKEHEAGVKTADLCRKHGISEASFYNWKAKYGGLGGVRSQAAEGTGERERQAEEAVGGRHARQRGAEGSAGKKMVTPAAKREAVAHLRSAFEMSERRACRTIGCVRMTVRYRSRRPDDAALRQRLRALAHERRRFGYRRLHVLLRREGFTVNHKRLVPALSRGAAHGASAGRPQAGFGYAGADAGPATAERSLVARLRLRSVHRRPPHAHPGRGRRLHARVPGARPRHLDLRHPGRPRTRSAARRSQASRRRSSATTAPS